MFFPLSSHFSKCKCNMLVAQAKVLGIHLWQLSSHHNTHLFHKKTPKTSISFSFTIDLKLDHSLPPLPLTSFSKSSYVSLNYCSSFLTDLLPPTLFLPHCVFPTQLSELPGSLSQSTSSLVIWTSITSLTLSLDILSLVYSALGTFPL